MPARTIDLEPHREWITSQVRAGRSIEYIRCHLPLIGPSVSYITLRRRLDAWNIRNTEYGEHGTRRRARREAGLEGAKDWIVASYERCDALKAIRGEIERQLGIVLSERRLQSLIHRDWGVPMRRERIESDEVRDLITTLAEDGRPAAQIKRYLQRDLGVRMCIPLIQGKLKEWHLVRPRLWNVVPIDENDLPAIREYMELTFYESKQTDADMQEQLAIMGYTLSLKQIARLRKGMGMVRRNQSADEDLERLREAISRNPRADILAPRLTKKMLPVFFKQEFKIPISRSMAWRFMQENYPEEWLTRVRQVARRRSGFLCPGPNYIWSIDAYCKLAHWGIEIYACIDAYSRFIIWAHAGHTAQTQRSVCLQYVDAIRGYGYLPLVIRSDHGVETGMIAGAHYWLSAASTEGRLLKPTRDEDGSVVWIHREVENGMEVRRVVRAGDEEPPPPTFAPHRNLDFRDCYSYGVSTKNQRIESWWQELNFFITGFWRDRFTYLEKEQYWSEFRIADRVALLYIYLPQIHWEVGKFIRLWNAHTIRKQRNRPHVVVGIPRNNYFSRDTEANVNCAVTVNPDSLAKLEEVLECDRQNVSEYLTPDIMRLCEAMMAGLGDAENPREQEPLPLLREYRHLRACLQQHEDDRSAPVLRLAQKPTGGWPALDAVVQQTGRSLADILGEEIHDEFDEEIDR